MMNRAPVHPKFSVTSGQRRARGFSLIEMIVSIVLLGILLAAAAPIFSTSLQSYVESRSRIDTLSKARFATERIARELREVRNAGGTYSFATMLPNAVSFTNASGTTVTITAAPPDVMLAYSVPNVSSILTDELGAATDLSFTYYDSSGIPGATAATVAEVQVSLTLTKDGVSYPQQTRVALRNH